MRGAFAFPDIGETMATVSVTYKPAMNAGMPIEASGFSSTQKLTSSGSSQVTTGQALPGEIAVVVTDGNIHVKLDRAPVAAADDTCEMIGAGRHHFSVDPGYKVAIIDA
jgi:hypothetical protein